MCVHAYTDNSNNALLFSPSYSVTDTAIAGWLLELQQDYPNLTLTHISGSSNSAADALSRNPAFSQHTTTPPSTLTSSDAWGLIGCVLGFQDGSLIPIFDQHSTSDFYTSDHSLNDKSDTQVVPPIFAFTGAALVLEPNANLQGKFVAAYPSDAYLSAHSSRFALREGLYFRPNGALYVPSTCVKLVLELEHNQGGHHGVAETERRVRRKFWFPHMHSLIKEYVQGCVICGRSKPSNQVLRAPLSHREFSDTQWDQVSMDFVCGLPVVAGGYDRVLTIVDRGLTKMAHFVKCKSTHTAEHIAQLFLQNVYARHGLPTKIICDQDPLFMSSFFKALMSKLRIQLCPGAVYHPQSDGQSEVTNRILKSYLLRFCEQHPSQWDKELWRAEFEYNYSQKTTGFSAFQLDMGRQPKRIEDVLLGVETAVPAVEAMFEQQQQSIQLAKAALNRAHQLAAKQHDKQSRAKQVAVGDKVYLSTLHLNIPIPGGCRKFKQPYTGPFDVIKVADSGGAATLNLPPSWLAARTWNVEYLKPYNPASNPIFSDSTVSLHDVAVQSDSVNLDLHPISVPSSGAVDVPQHVTSEGMEAATKVVDRIVNFRSKRGSNGDQYLLSFKDQPASENMWVDVSECGVLPGFGAALAVRNARIADRGKERHVSFAV